MYIEGILINYNDSNFLPLMPTVILFQLRAFFSLFYENLFSILSSASNLDPFNGIWRLIWKLYRSMYSHLDTIQDSFPLEFSKQILNGDII